MRRAPRHRPRPLRLLAVLFAAVLFAGACSDDGPDETGGDTSIDTTVDTTVDSQDPGAGVATLATVLESPGPWGVAVRTVEVTGARDRALTVEVWYPVEPEAASAAEPASYDFPGLEVPSESAVSDVPPAAGEFPLVVYSHGNGGLRYVSAFLTEHLASHGFVVVAPDHAGNTAIDSFAGTATEQTQVAIDRPVDVAAVIDAATSGAAGLEDVAAVVDGESVGVMGHSFGGYTALALAGGLGDEEADDRVDAVIGMAAATRSLDDPTLAGVAVPTLLLSGTMDQTTPIGENTERPWDLVEGRPLVRADIADAGHQSFTDVCSYTEIAQSRPELPEVLVDAVAEYAREGCAEELIDIDEAHRIVRRLATAFLLQELGAEDDWAALLDADAGADDALASLERRD